METAKLAPWRYTGEHYGDRGGRFHEIVDANGDTVVGEWGGPYSAADARLIAASPELAAAVAEAIAVLEPFDADVRGPAFNTDYPLHVYRDVRLLSVKLRESLAKARGEKTTVESA